MFVERLIDYRFHSIVNLIQALTAAGAEEGNHDGNRKLAQFGTSLIEFLLVFLNYEAASTRSTKQLMTIFEDKADIL